MIKWRKSKVATFKLTNKQDIRLLELIGVVYLLKISAFFLILTDNRLLFII